MTEVLLLSGAKVDWAKPPKPSTLVQWSRKTTGGKQIKGSFRTICWLDRVNDLSKKRFGKEIEVIQAPYNTGVSASAGTHDFDACLDVNIPGVDWWTQQRFFRANGSAAWYRYPPKFGNHIHLIVLPPREGQSINDDFRVIGIKVGKYVDGGWSVYGSQVTSSQLGDYYDHAFGLSEMHIPNSDKSWHPEDIASTIFDLPKYVKGRAPKEAPVDKPPKGEQPIKTEFNRPRIDGIDISRYQSGRLDLGLAEESGVRFCWHKATEGTSVKDPFYIQRRQEFGKSDIPFGAYHFARAEAGDALDEARYFLSVADPKTGDLRPALDLETMEGMGIDAICTWANTFIQECKKQTGVLPVVYTPFDLGTVDDGCVIWRPRYNNSNTPPVLPWDIWQFSNGVYGNPRSVPGIGNIDINTVRAGLKMSDLLIPKKK